MIGLLGGVRLGCVLMPLPLSMNLHCVLASIDECQTAHFNSVTSAVTFGGLTFSWQVKHVYSRALRLHVHSVVVAAAARRGRAELGGSIHLLGHSERWRGNVTKLPILHSEISPSQEHAVGSIFKWVCLLTLVGVARVPAIMKTTTEQE